MRKALLILMIICFTEQFLAQPVISSFAPSSGPVGTVVTITGSNFNTIPTNNTVFFGAVKADVTNCTATSLTVMVPVGATYKYISVTDITINLSAYSAQPFMVTFGCGGVIDSSSFSNVLDSTVGGGSRYVAVSDLDGDGKSDLAVVNQFSNSISILKNTSSGSATSFAEKNDYATGNQPFCVAVGDFDGDGKPDLAVAINNNGSSGKFSIYRNTSVPGAISFAAKVDFIAALNPQSIAIGDLDGDGKPEVVVANYMSNTISVFKNTCTAGVIAFAAKVDYVTGTGPRTITIGDLNGDNKPDIATANYTAYSVSIFKNISTQGTVSMASKVDFVMTYNAYTSSVVIGDLNGDNKPELVISNSGESAVSVLRNIGTGGAISFAPKVNFILEEGCKSASMDDLDGDGKLDLVIANYGYSLLKNTSQNNIISFAAEVHFSGNATEGISIGDLDGDGKPDIASAHFGNTVSIFRNGVNSPFMVSSPTASIFSGGTVNIPLLSNVASNYVWMASNNPNTTGESTTFQTTNSLTNTIVNTSEYDQIVTYTVIPTEIGSGCTGTSQIVNVLVALRPPVITSFSPTSGPVGTTVTISGSNFSTIPSNNSVFFGATQASVSSATANSLVVTVPDGANYQCISVSNQATHLTAYANESFVVTYPCTSGIDDLSFDLKMDFAVGTDLVGLEMNDFDLDGKPDLAIVNRNINTISVMKNSSIFPDVTFEPKVDFATGSTPGPVVTGDINGDGKPDIAVINSGSNTISVLINTSQPGVVSFAPKIDFPIGNLMLNIAMGDLNGDGKPDLLIGGSGNGYGDVSILKNTSANGSVSFAQEAVFDGGLRLVSIGDLNGDNKPEIIIDFNGDIQAYKNTSNNGIFSFLPVPPFEMMLFPSDIAIGDLDGDGKPDLVIPNSGDFKVSVFRNTSSSGTVSFGAEQILPMQWNSLPYSISIGDLDGDGKPDLAVANHNDDLYLNNTVCVFNNISTFDSITFAPRVDYLTGYNPNCVRIGDLNGNSKPELIVSSFDEKEVSVFRNVKCVTIDVPENRRQSGISLYPNPFTSVTTMTFEKEVKVVVKILDVLGKEVRNVSFTGTELLLEKGELNIGVYFLQVISDKEMLANEKIVIQ